MPEIVLPESLITLQRAVYAAEAAVEAHRRGVDARREADPRVESKWGPALRGWTEAEDTEHARLMAAVLSAAEARRAGIVAAGLGDGYDVVQALHAAAREV